MMIDGASVYRILKTLALAPVRYVEFEGTLPNLFVLGILEDCKMVEHYNFGDNLAMVRLTSTGLDLFCDMEKYDEEYWMEDYSIHSMKQLIRDCKPGEKESDT